MTKVDVARAVRVGGVVLIVAAALDRLLGLNNMTVLHGILMLLGLTLLGASVAIEAEKVS